MVKILVIIGICTAFALGVAVGRIIEWVKEEKRMDKMEWQLNRMKAFYNMSMQWLKLKQDGINLSEYFKFNGYKSIAIYGMSGFGERLAAELQGTGIEVRYIVDQNADNIETQFAKYKPMEDLPAADVMVVTAIVSFQDIQEMMEKRVDMPIISLEDVVYGLG